MVDTPISDVQVDVVPDQLPFPPVTKEHIRNCAVPAWLPKYRSLVPKSRIIPLNDAFISYLKSDGIVLPDEEDADPEWEDSTGTEEAQPPHFEDWSHIHEQIKETLKSLGGRVHPKLDWSAPKDATWIVPGNTMECRSANDIYLLLKSSDFVTHDLQQPYYGCEEAENLQPEDKIEYHLILRRSVQALISSMEFRCFVRRKRLIAVCQRDINHYDFMESLIPTLQFMIYDFFMQHLRSFSEDSFAFDVYIPRPRELGKVWLLDINPWAPRTDPLLFSWLDLLTRSDLPEEPEIDDSTVRFYTRAAQESNEDHHANGEREPTAQAEAGEAEQPYDEPREDGEGEEDIDSIPAYIPEFLIVRRNDPETYSFNTPLYSAHKLPKDIVDASKRIEGQGGMREFLENWHKQVADMENGVDGISDNDT